MLIVQVEFNFQIFNSALSLSIIRFFPVVLKQGISENDQNEPKWPRMSHTHFDHFGSFCLIQRFSTTRFFQQLI